MRNGIIKDYFNILLLDYKNTPLIRWFLIIQIMKRNYLIILIAFLSLQTYSQVKDTVACSNKKNTIRWNMTPFLMIGPKSIVLGYERVIRPNQSISINVGYLEKSPMTDDNDNPVYLFKESSNSGFDLSLDYRFYFKNRNKRLAPDGVYWGPYFSYYNLNYTGKSEFLENGVVSNTIGIDMGMNMYSLGAQIGYQFVIADRFTVDLIFMGPSFTRYSFRFQFNADTELDKDSDFYKKLEALIEKNYPMAEEILSGKEITGSGNLDYNFFGFRYVIQVGYRF